MRREGGVGISHWSFENETVSVTATEVKSDIELVACVA